MTELVNAEHENLGSSLAWTPLQMAEQGAVRIYCARIDMSTYPPRKVRELIKTSQIENANVYCFCSARTTSNSWQY